MSKSKKMISTMVLCAIICSMFLTGCGKKDKDEHLGDEAKTTTEAQVEEKTYFKMQTSIAYSSGDSKNWTYGNQRKEFPNNKSCYVRIGTTAITTGLFGKGKGDPILVTYRFTGTDNCKVEVSDGKAIKVNTGNTNITEYTHTVTAATEKKASEDVMIFRYSPNGADSVILEVIFDDQVAEKYDEFNTVYFNEVTGT